MTDMTLRLLRPLSWLVAVPVLLAGLAAWAVAGSPAASAAPLAAPDGWVRIAHLSPQAPAMDMYLYPFGDPAHPTVLKDVAYGDVSAYMALAPGQYTVAMRGFDASASSQPALVSSFMVSAQTADTVAALGPDPGLKVDVLKDQMSTPSGKALVRVLQASLKQNQVTVSSGSAVLAQGLALGTVTPYTAVAAGERTLKMTAGGGDAAMSLTLTSDTVHTIVVLDGPSGLKADVLTDAVGIGAMPAGGAATGLGGTAVRPPAVLTPWLLTLLAGALLVAGGAIGIGRSRRAAAARG
jgi:hypothetical protein